MSLSSWYQDWHNNPNHKVIHWFAFGLASIALIVFTKQDLNSYSKSLDELNPFRIEMAEAMTVTVASDRVNIGAEYIMRRTDLPNQLIVPVGQTVELPADATYDYVEVSGTLRVSRSHDTTTRFTTMIVMPGGNLDVGTQADPIPCARKVDFIVRDVPINTSIDPFQWGNGLVNFGKETRVGCAKTSFVEANGSLAAGANTITLGSIPSGWAIGDELLIPDTAAPSVQIGSGVVASRRESKVAIAAINGSSVTLSKGLDFAHANIIDLRGTLVLKPRVADLTRNIIIHSENSNGTRGHTADIGNASSWDIRYNQFYDLGRTRNIPLEDTNLSTGHIGTNQRGKYTEHHHHVESAVGSSDVGNVIIGEGANGGKWGLAIHGTSDALIQDNIAIDFPGAGIVTEDGYEVRNVFRHNLSAYIIGNNLGDGLGNIGDADVNAGCPGCEGSGFWFRGIQNTFDSNEGWDSFRGINLFNQQQPAGMYPSVPGGSLDTVNNNHNMLPISVTGNVAAGNSLTGYELWATHRFPNVNLISANNGAFQVIGVQSDAIEHYYVNPTVVCPSAINTFGIHADFAYTASLEMQGGYVGGCGTGIANGGGSNYAKVISATLQNATDYNAVSPNALFDNVMFLPLGNFPHQYIMMNDVNLESTGNPAYIWPGLPTPLPNVGSATRWGYQHGSQYVVKNWQGTGKDYLLFTAEQLGSNPAWPSGYYKYMWDAPVSGLTMLQSWQTFGISYGGDVLEEKDAVALDGLIYGKARLGLGVNFGPPRAVVTLPTMSEPALGPNNDAPANTGYVSVYALVTGDPNGASDRLYYSVDGDTPKYVGQFGETYAYDERNFNTPHAQAGLHTVSVWRTQKGDPSVELAGSRMNSQYCVNPCPVISQGHESLSPTSLTFNAVSGGASPPAQNVTLTNTGPVAMNWTLNSNPGWCHGTQPTFGSTAAGANTTLTIYVDAPTNVGSFTCNIAVNSTNADNAPQAITITYNVSSNGTTPPPVNPPPVTPPPVTPPPVTPPPVTPPPSPSITGQRTISINQLEGRTNKIVTGSVSVLNSSKVLVKSYAFTTDSAGSFTLNFDITPIVGYLKFKAGPFLQKLLSVDLNSTATYTLTKLLTGDINQDNIVNSIDFSAMNAKWFTSDTATDLNQDGLINTLDYSLINKNWLTQGD